MFKKLFKYILLAIPTLALTALVFSQTPITGDWEFISDGTRYNAIYRRGFLGLGATNPSSQLDLTEAFTQRGMAVPPAVSPAGQGRIYFDTAIMEFKVSENGAAYLKLVPPGGAIGGAGAAGQATFWTAPAVVSGDNDFWWDNVNKFLGVGTNVPLGKLHVESNLSGLNFGINLVIPIVSYPGNNVYGINNNITLTPNLTAAGLGPEMIGLNLVIRDVKTANVYDASTSIGANINVGAYNPDTPGDGSTLEGIRLETTAYLDRDTIYGLNVGTNATQTEDGVSISNDYIYGGFFLTTVTASKNNSPISFSNDVTGLYARVGLINSGTGTTSISINNLYGLYCNPVTSGVYTINGGAYGIYITDTSPIVATSGAYNLYSAGTTAKHFFGGSITGTYVEAAAAADGTRYFQYTVNSSSDPAATAEVTSLYGSYNWTAGTNGVFIVNGVEGAVRSRANDEAGTFRGGYFRTYIDTDTNPNASMRTAVGAEISARASRLGGPEAIAELGTAFIGARIWMAPYFTDASIPNINNSHALWILNETPNGGAWGKYIDRAITVDATTYGSGFNYNFYTDTGKFYMYLDGTKSGSGVVSGERSTASGDDWMSVRVSDYRTFTSGQVYNGAFFRYDVRATVPGAPQCEVRGLEAVGSTYVADGNLLSLFGAVLRTFIQPGVTASAKTSIGAEISARASFNGGADCEALPGTAFVGARIYMAPYFTAATLGNINNFWGLWIYGEHASQRNADSAIKIGSAGGGFTNDINFQNGSTLTDLLGGLKLVNNTGGTNPALYINEQTLGNEILRLESVSTGDDPNYRAFQNRVTTTDATVTAIHTIALSDDSVYLIHVYIAARRTGGTGGTAGDVAGYTIIGTFKRSAAGVATQIGSTIKTSQEDQAGWDADFGVSGNNAIINITGAVNNNVTWHTTVFLSNLSS